MKIYKFFTFTFLLYINHLVATEIEYLFAHGFGGNKNQIVYYQNNNIIPKPYIGISYDGPEVRYNQQPDLKKTVMAQDDDIDVLTKAIASINKKIVGIGVSKGGATWINAASKPENINKLAALVLDASFANANEVIRKIFYLEHVPGGSLLTKQLIKKYLPTYKPDGIQPIDSIKQISNKKLPILIIHSLYDKLVDIKEARQLYNEFINNGFTNVHFVGIKTGQHANIIYKTGIQRKVNAFYKKYNLPYDKLLADKTHLYSYENIDC